MSANCCAHIAAETPVQERPAHPLHVHGGSVCPETRAQATPQGNGVHVPTEGGGDTGLRVLPLRNLRENYASDATVAVAIPRGHKNEIAKAKNGNNNSGSSSTGNNDVDGISRDAFVFGIVRGRTEAQLVDPRLQSPALPNGIPAVQSPVKIVTERSIVSVPAVTLSDNSSSLSGGNTTSNSVHDMNNISSNTMDTKKEGNIATVFLKDIAPSMRTSQTYSAIESHGVSTTDGRRHTLGGTPHEKDVMIAQTCPSFTQRDIVVAKHTVTRNAFSTENDITASSHIDSKFCEISTSPASVKKDLRDAPVAKEVTPNKQERKEESGAEIKNKQLPREHREKDADKADVHHREDVTDVPRPDDRAILVSTVVFATDVDNRVQARRTSQVLSKKLSMTSSNTTEISHDKPPTGSMSYIDSDTMDAGASLGRPSLSATMPLESLSVGVEDGSSKHELPESLYFPFSAEVLPREDNNRTCNVLRNEPESKNEGGKVGARKSIEREGQEVEVVVQGKPGKEEEVEQGTAEVQRGKQEQHQHPQQQKQEKQKHSPLTKLWEPEEKDARDDEFSLVSSGCSQDDGVVEETQLHTGEVPRFESAEANHATERINMSSSDEVPADEAMEPQWLQSPTLFFLVFNLIELHEARQRQQECQQQEMQRHGYLVSAKGPSDSVAPPPFEDIVPPHVLAELYTQVSHSVLEVEGVLLKRYLTYWSDVSLRDAVARVVRVWQEGGPNDAEFEDASFQLLTLVSEGRGGYVERTSLFPIWDYVGSGRHTPFLMLCTVVCVFLALVSVLLLLFIGGIHVALRIVFSVLAGLLLILLGFSGILLLDHSSFTGTVRDFCCSKLTDRAVITVDGINNGVNNDINGNFDFVFAPNRLNRNGGPNGSSNQGDVNRANGYLRDRSCRTPNMAPGNVIQAVPREVGTSTCRSTMAMTNRGEFTPSSAFSMEGSRGPRESNSGRAAQRGTTNQRNKMKTSGVGSGNTAADATSAFLNRQSSCSFLGNQEPENAYGRQEQQLHEENARVGDSQRADDAKTYNSPLLGNEAMRKSDCYNALLMSFVSFKQQQMAEERMKDRMVRSRLSFAGANYKRQYGEQQERDIAKTSLNTGLGSPKLEVGREGRPSFLRTCDSGDGGGLYWNEEYDEAYGGFVDSRETTGDVRRFSPDSGSLAQFHLQRTRGSILGSGFDGLLITALVYCRSYDLRADVYNELWNKNFLILQRNSLAALDAAFHLGSERFKVFLLHAPDLDELQLQTALTWLHQKRRPVFFFAAALGTMPSGVPYSVRLETPLTTRDVETVLLSGIGVDEEINSVSIFRPSKQFKVPPYTLGRRLGGGAYGNVFEVEMEVTGARCAVKRMYLRGDNDDCGSLGFDSQLKAIAREAEIMSSLSHPNIVQYLFCERDGNCVSIFMELCSGGSLRSHIEREGGGLRVAEQIKRILRDVIGAVSYLHGKHIVHRDLKPENVLFRDGQAKVSDFGTAVFKRGGIRHVEGTFAYMAPEVLLGQTYGKACDVWSIGCIAAETLSVDLPHRSLGLPELCATYRRMAFDATLEFSCSEPTVCDFLNLCLQRNPMRRSTLERLLEHPMLREGEMVESSIQRWIATREGRSRSLHQQQRLGKPAPQPSQSHAAAGGSCPATSESSAMERGECMDGDKDYGLRHGGGNSQSCSTSAVSLLSGALET